MIKSNKQSISTPVSILTLALLLGVTANCHPSGSTARSPMFESGAMSADPTDPLRASPYSPSSRQRLNVLYIDVEAADDFAHCEAARRRVESPEFQGRLAALTFPEEATDAT